MPLYFGCFQAAQVWAGLFSHPEKAPHHFIAEGLLRARFRSSGFGVQGRRKQLLLRRQKPPNRSYKVFSRTGFGGLRPKEQKNLQGAKKQPNRPYKVFSLPGFGGLKPKEQKNKET